MLFLLISQNIQSQALSSISSSFFYLKLFFQSQALSSFLFLQSQVRYCFFQKKKQDQTQHRKKHTTFHIMASSSHNNEGVNDENFDQYFDETFDNFLKNYGGQEDEMKRRKKEFISKEIVKKATYGYGMIISVIIQHIVKLISDAVLE